MYVNMCTEAMRFIKANKTADARKELLNAYDAMAVNEAFDEIDYSCFTELSQRYRNERAKKKRDFDQVNARFSITRPPPKKIPVQQPSRDKRTIDEGNDDEEEQDDLRLSDYGSSTGDFTQQVDGAFDDEAYNSMPSPAFKTS